MGNLIEAQIECLNGVSGRVVHVLINPFSEQITHLVIKEISTPSTEYIVPIDLVPAMIASTIQIAEIKSK